MYASIVHDHLYDTRLPTFETLSFFAYLFFIAILKMGQFLYDQKKKKDDEIRSTINNEQCTDSCLLTNFAKSQFLAKKFVSFIRE